MNQKKLFIGLAVLAFAFGFICCDGNIPVNGTRIPPKYWNISYSLLDDNPDFLRAEAEVENESGGHLSVAYGRGIFVVGDIYGRISCSTNKGNSWTTVDSGLDGVSSIAYAGGIFIATSYGAEMAVSSDGINWVVNETPSVAIRTLYSCNGIFAGEGFKGGLSISPDGISWNYGATPATFGGIAYGNGALVVVGEGKSGGKIYCSTDLGEEWEYNDDKDFPGICSVLFGDGVFVAFTLDGVLTSSNGLDWDIGGEYNNGRYAYIENDAHAYGGNAFVVSINNKPVGTSFYYSIDNGRTWDRSAIDFDDEIAINSIAYGSGYFVAVGAFPGEWGFWDGEHWEYQYGNGSICYSGDMGKTWEAIDSQIDCFISDVVYGDGTFVAVGNDGKIYYANVR